jgi:LPXTG-motif cell wall-anchored protein
VNGVTCRVRRALALIVASAIAVGGLIGATAGPAAAASPVILVSTDGVNYTSSLSVGLFDDAGLLVPGGSATAQLWIKNPTADPATMRVSIGQVATSSVDLGENMTLTALNTAADKKITRNLDDLPRCAVMVQPFTIAGGAILRVDLTLTMLNATGLRAQHQDASFGATVVMRDDAAGSFPVSTCDPATDGPGPMGQHEHVLGFTGDSFPTGLVILAGMLLGVGWFFVALRRRRKSTKSAS